MPAATRRLAAILAADVAGYSRLMGADEEGTLAALKAIRRELGDPKVREHRGRIVKTTGDGLLVEFASVVDAVRCAAEVQQAMAERNAGVPAERRIEFRMGINLGDVIHDGRDIFGDGVNIAARLEALAEPGGVCVSRVVHDQVQDRLDLAFEDMGERQMKNIARPVHLYRIAIGGRAPSSPAPPDLPDKPSIAVLPFQNMSGDPEQDYFADGMVEEIVTALSRIRWLFVIARNSSFTYKGQAVDVKQVGHELGVRYVLEGSVRKAGNRVRITGQLVDAVSGAHLWADHFDGSLEDVFDLQDQVATSVSGVIEPALQAAESRRAVARPTSDLAAYDLYIRALPTMFRFGREDLLSAARLFEQAIARDPSYGAALAHLAICHQRLAMDWADDAPARRERAMALARRALEVAGDDPAVLANAAFTLASFGESLPAMTALIDRALALNPSYARGWYLSAVLRLFAEQPDQAIEHIERSRRLSPRDDLVVPVRLGIVGVAHLIGRRFDLAAENLMLSVRQAPRMPWHYWLLAASYVHLGRMEDAREIVAQLRAMGAVVIPSHANGVLRIQGVRELVVSALRLAVAESEGPEVSPGGGGPG